MQERLDLGDEFLRQVLELRTKAGLHALPGPHQLLTERRQRRAFAAMGFDQRHAEELGPLLDQIPDMPIGKPGVVCRAGELAGSADFIEHTEHDDCGLRAAFLVKTPDGFDLDMQHRSGPL